MARAAQLQGLVAVEGLHAGLDVGAGVLGVVDVHRHVDLDAADRVDHRDELVEVDLCVVGDGHAGKLGHGLDEQGSPAIGVGRVDLLGAVVATQVYGRVALNRDER